ncbi:FxDxF family PEP-CTERM protein [Duganella aceris]|nr:FxDxF family PEP-CTERM protein [Duganella aceris]
MKLKTIVAGAMLAAASFAASATNHDLGTLDSSGPDSSPFGYKISTVGEFNDYLTFTLDVASATAFGTQQNFTATTQITGFGAELMNVTGGTFAPITTGSQQSLSWSGSLAAGEYTVHVWGITPVKNLSYSGTVTATPVPEPETYGMMLGGLALVGAIARRKAKKAA